jgi:hypothetical protein
VLSDLFLISFSTLKMKVVHFSETFLSFYHTTGDIMLFRNRFYVSVGISVHFLHSVNMVEASELMNSVATRR